MAHQTPSLVRSLHKPGLGICVPGRDALQARSLSLRDEDVTVRRGLTRSG
jgi:hypothetical protein